MIESRYTSTCTSTYLLVLAPHNIFYFFKLSNSSPFVLVVLPSVNYSVNNTWSFENGRLRAGCRLCIFLQIRVVEEIRGIFIRLSVFPEYNRMG